MLKICQKCNHPNPAATGRPTEACPECGALYNPAAAATTAAPPQEFIAPANPATAFSQEQPRMKHADEKFCSECGSTINAKAEICPKCGVRQMAAPSASPLGQTSSSGKNKVVAGLLALFLGGIGVHKFYLGKGFQGLLYLVFCWSFIPAVIGLVEGLNYLLMSEKTFFERYGA
jgi:TM2 domain-containing membrane protein YozV